MNCESLIKSYKQEGRLVIPEKEAKEILELAGIPTLRPYVVKSVEEAVATARRIKFPVALKLSSPRFLHKSEAGGVDLNLAGEKEVAASFGRLSAMISPNDRLDNIVIQKMAPPGIELILGVFRDAHFGPVIMLGLGGIFAEVIKDVTYRLIPIQQQQARDMIRSLQCRLLLEGFRGADPVDQQAIIEAILKVSQLVSKNQDLKELDINPLVAYRQGVLALDARLVLH